jgi:hypothetical protein
MMLGSLLKEPTSSLDFEVEIPTVSIETESFVADALEIYELPAGIVFEMLAQPGPAQIQVMVKMLQMALIQPEKADDLGNVSFNERTDILYQWYSKSPVRVGNKSMPSVSLEDIIGPPEGDEREY